MSVRISSERLAQLIDFASWPQLHESVTPEVASALSELQQSRALVADLRALAERMRKYNPAPDRVPQYLTSHELGARAATYAWHSELSSLLAAHDAQQADQQPNG